MYTRPRNRRKFRSQTSDLWTHAATVVKAARKEKETKEKESEERDRRERDRRERERVRAKKEPEKRDSADRRSKGAKKVEKSGTLWSSNIFVAPEGRQVRSIKRRLLSHLLR